MRVTKKGVLYRFLYGCGFSRNTVGGSLKVALGIHTAEHKGSARATG